MTAEVAQRLEERLCSVVASTAQLDPAGSGSYIDRLFTFELPAPWGGGLYEGNPEGTGVQRMRAIQQDYFARLRDAGEYEAELARGYPSFNGIQPDHEWSLPGMVRVLWIRRPSAPMFGDFEVFEFAIPKASGKLVELTDAFFNAPADISAFEDFRVNHAGHREFFVCTHGHVDICCAKFGIPLYLQARAAYPTVRAWRMTHFGGHRYAPTAWEFPSGYKWAFLDGPATDRVIKQDSDAAHVALKVRGWSGAPLQAQVLDREGLKRFGWRWLDFKRRAEVIADSGPMGPWRARVTFESPQGKSGSLEADVVVAREVRDVGCGPKWGRNDVMVKEYALQNLIENSA